MAYEQQLAARFTDEYGRLKRAEWRATLREYARPFFDELTLLEASAGAGGAGDESGRRASERYMGGYASDSAGGGREHAMHEEPHGDAPTYESSFYPARTYAADGYGGSGPAAEPATEPGAAEWSMWSDPEGAVEAAAKGPYDVWFDEWLGGLLAGEALAQAPQLMERDPRPTSGPDDEGPPRLGLDALGRVVELELADAPPLPAHPFWPAEEREFKRMAWVWAAVPPKGTPKGPGWDGLEMPRFEKAKPYPNDGYFDGNKGAEANANATAEGGASNHSAAAKPKSDEEHDKEHDEMRDEKHDEKPLRDQEPKRQPSDDDREDLFAVFV